MMMGQRHTDREYEQELTELRTRLVEMANLVQRMIANAVKALGRRDVALARRTIEEDHMVNRAEVEADELCLVILAKRQPMASDLRFITLALKMVTDLERIGDLAVNICERAMELANRPPFGLFPEIERMAEIAQSMVRDAISAFVRGDVEMARQVIARDDEADELYFRVFRKILQTIIDDPTNVEPKICYQRVVKFLERIADHSTNLAEQVVFMVRGKDIRHIGKLGES